MRRISLPPQAAWNHSGLRTVLLLVFVFAALKPIAAATPAQKDSSPRYKPKDVVVTASVEPAKAKPGDTVTYRITAKLADGSHIYKYVKHKPGPTDTRFDFFDTAGLKPIGEWTASEPPIRRADPANNNQVSEFHEGEVTWSHELKIPTDIPAGEKTLRCQAGYQVCNDTKCSIPGQWTLPGVVLTVLPGGPAPEKEAAPSAPSDAALTPASAPAPAPAVGTGTESAPPPATAVSVPKDSNPRFKPKDAVLTASVEPAQGRPGDTVTYRVTAKLDAGSHIYKYVKDKPSLRDTTFNFFELAGLEPVGEWTPSTPPIKRADPASNNEILEFHEGEVTWSHKLKVPSDATPGERTLRCQVGYQVCNDTKCSIPGRWTLPDVVLAVVSGGPAPADVTTVSPPASSPAAASGPGTEVPPPLASPPVQTPAAPTETAPPPKVAAPTEPLDTSAAQPVSEVADRAAQGLLSFLLFSAGGGLLALVMPCVWPMVPITVNFFVKQGHHNKGKTTGLAIAYCLAIIGVFTSFGVLVSFFFSAAALQNLANNPWLNTAVAVLFLAFGLSLLGLFEIRLPNFLLNASARGESRGGLIGVMFMALTLTITSFTCTFPVVGGLVVMAAGGQFFYPIIGLATFSAVLAFPFFLLALAPSLISKMPKSGDWMNAVKVVGGLIEVGAALKFINTAELGFGAVPEDAWFDASVVLSVWVGLAAVCGLYLLGVFRTDHDSDDVKIGPGRLLIGSLFLALSLFLAPALFGHPPKSPLWDLLVGILPADVEDLNAPTVNTGTEVGKAVAATSSVPDVAEREQKAFHGVVWGMSYDAALEEAKTEKKPILIDFTGVNCANCRAMEQGVLPRKEVVNLLSKFVTVELYTDIPPIASLTIEQRLVLAEKNQTLLLDLAQETSNPVYVALGPDGRVLRKIGGKVSPTTFVAFLNDALGKLPTDRKLAQSEATR